MRAGILVAALAVSAALIAWGAAVVRDMLRPSLTDVMRATGDPEDEL